MKIKSLNTEISENYRFFKDIFNMDLQKEKMEHNSINCTNNRKRYLKHYNGISLKRINLKLIKSLKNNIDPSAPINIRFALTIGYAKQKTLPTDVPLISSLETVDLNRLATTDLNFCSPVAVLYSSKDNLWCYAISEVYTGWIKAENLVFSSKKAISDYINHKNIAVVTSRFADLYKDVSLSQFYDSVKMGTVLHISKIQNDIIQVKIPVKSSDEKLKFTHCYIQKTNVSLGFLPYTQRNVITQAFKQIGTPYDWGNNYWYSDRYSFIKQVFL